jgi:hypothetical protein
MIVSNDAFNLDFSKSDIGIYYELIPAPANLLVIGGANL